ncbi:hypothetical protein Tco_1173717 [Tanacetum coccineum]
MSKPLLLKGRPGHLTVGSEYFFNNDLEYLKSSDLEKKYTTSITKTKAARYELAGIEDMIPSLWSVTKVGYDKYVERGIKHWGPKRQLFYRSQLNRFSKHDVYSHLKILSVKSVKVNKLHSYGYLEEIVDMLLIGLQQRLFQLNGNDIVDLAVALRMFTRILIIKRRFEDVQLGLSCVVYEDLNKRKRVMRADELYKLSDMTLKLVRDELHHKILNFHLGYNKEMSKRKWSATDKRRSELMVELIDKQRMLHIWSTTSQRLVNSGQPPPDHRPTVVNSGVSDGQSVVNGGVSNGQQWSTPVNHRQTAGQPPSDHQSMVVNRRVRNIDPTNIFSKHRDLVHEQNACKEQLLVLKQAKLDFLTMQHVNTEILKENKNLRTELKELTTITKTWVNSSNKVNQCISEQIPSLKKRILGVDQLTKDLSSSRQKVIVFVKSSDDDTKVSIPGVVRSWLSKAEGFILPNHDTDRILPAESQRNITNPLVAVTDSSTTDYDSADESSLYSTPLPPLKKLDGAEPISRQKTIKSILRSKSTFNAETLKGVIINEPSSAPAKGNKRSLALKVNSTPAGKLKSVKIEDDPPLAIVIKELNDLKLQISKNQSSYSRNNQQVDPVIRSKIPRPSKSFFPPCIHCGCIDHLSNKCLNYPICGLCGSYDHDTNGPNRIINLEREINLRNPQHAFKRYEACGSSTHTTTDHYDIEWFKRGEALQAKKAESLKSTRDESSNANRSKTPTKRWVSKQN